MQWDRDAGRLDFVVYDKLSSNPVGPQETPLRRPQTTRRSRRGARPPARGPRRNVALRSGAASGYYEWAPRSERGERFRAAGPHRTYAAAISPAASIGSVVRPARQRTKAPSRALITASA